MSELALFPLHTVLFPDGPLPLRIFEPRYLDMVSRCLKQQQGFGVCLIREGAEAGRAVTHSVGTLARIGDWSGGEDGLLHIMAYGRERFRVQNTRVQADGLHVGEVEWLAAELPVALPDTAQSLAELLRQIVAQAPAHYRGVAPHYEDAGWVGYRLAELLPLPLAQRQYLLESNDPLKRLEILGTLVETLAAR